MRVRSESVEAFTTTALVVDDPYGAYAQVAAQLHPPERPPAGIHAAAVVAEEAACDATAHVGASAVVEAGAEIHAGAVVSPGAYVGARALVAAGAWIGANAVLGADCRLGERSCMHPGAVVGADGFGYASPAGGQGWRKVPQLGGVDIGEDVEIGSNTTIDRGSLDDTVIEAGAKLDDQVHIAHNVRVGARTAIAGHVGIAGSSVIGRGCMIGGVCGIADHVEIADGVTLQGMTAVTGSITESGVYASPLPARPVREWRRNTVRFTQLERLFQRVRRLEAGAEAASPRRPPGERDE